MGLKPNLFFEFFIPTINRGAINVYLGILA